jgi:tRNA(fMet)-specific endonuclease VapC
LSLWILDADHISLHQRENLLMMQRLSTIAPNNIAITIISVEEQLRGSVDLKTVSARNKGKG